MEISNIVLYFLRQRGIYYSLYTLMWHLFLLFFYLVWDLRFSIKDETFYCHAFMLWSYKYKEKCLILNWKLINYQQEKLYSKLTLFLKTPYKISFLIFFSSCPWNCKVVITSSRKEFILMGMRGRFDSQNVLEIIIIHYFYYFKQINISYGLINQLYLH